MGVGPKPRNVVVLASFAATVTSGSKSRDSQDVDGRLLVEEMSRKDVQISVAEVKRWALSSSFVTHHRQQDTACSCFAIEYKMINVVSALGDQVTVLAKRS